jgi:integrase
MDFDRPAPIPVVLRGPQICVDGVVGPHRRPKGAGQAWSWRLVWRQDGAQKQRSLGRLEARDALAAATQRWREVVGNPAAACTRRTQSCSPCTPAPRADLDRDAVPPTAPTKPTPWSTEAVDGAGHRVSELLEAFLSWHDARPSRAKRKPRTLEEYRQRCALLADALGGLPLAELDDDVCEQLADRMFEPDFRAAREAAWDARRAAHQTTGPRARGRGYSVNTVNQALSMLGIVLRWGARRGWEVPGVRPQEAGVRGGGAAPEDRVNRHYTPEDTEVEELLAGMRASPVRRAILLCWRCGVRAGELSALRWCDLVSTEAGTFLMVGANPTAEGHRKTALQKVRRVAVPADVREVLERDRPCSNPDAPIAQGASWADRMVEVQARRGVPYERQFTPHGLRRRFCSNLLDAGASIGLYVDQAGHSPRVALQTYYRATDRRRQSLQVQVSGVTSGVDLAAVVAELGLTLEEAEQRLRAGGPAAVAAR